MRIKNIAASLILILFFSCGKSAKKQVSIELIAEADKQNTIFNNLVNLTNNGIPDELYNDSLAFLILPVQASCPSCRNKTIDSIVTHQHDLLEKHFIIISAKGGRKTINGYFQEAEKELPSIKNKLFLDSLNMAYEYSLYDKKPTVYYTYNRKAYKKVAAIPSTVKDDLREFFSGNRNVKK